MENILWQVRLKFTLAVNRDSDCNVPMSKELCARNW